MTDEHTCRPLTFLNLLPELEETNGEVSAVVKMMGRWERPSQSEIEFGRSRGFAVFFVPIARRTVEEK